MIPPIVPGTRYGCHNRAPITTYGAQPCQYTLSAQGKDKLAKDDPRCAGCIEQKK
jgi:hypothetical protein